MEIQSVTESHSDLVSITLKKMKGSEKIFFLILLTILIFVILGLLIALIVVLHLQHGGISGQSTGSRSANSMTKNRPSLTVPDCVLLLDSPDPHLDLAKCLLDSYPLIDGHNDLSWQFLNNVNNKVYNSVDFSTDLREVWKTTKTHFPSHTDIPRLRQGKVGAQFWAIFAPCSSQYKDAVRRSLEQTDFHYKLFKKYSKHLKYVTTAQGILDAFHEGRIASLMGLEGGHSIDSSLANLRMFYKLGCRYMTFTHSCNTPWADNWKVDLDKSSQYNGLTEFGKIVIKEMNRLGMIIDLSHVAKETMINAIQVSNAPVIFSHSSAYGYCNHYRNVQDDVLRMTKENGGLVMVNFGADFINCKPNKQPNATLSQVADHIEYIKNSIGIEYVGIGADYDGVPVQPVGLEDVSRYPYLFAELIRRGWPKEDLRKLAGENLIRVFRKVEQVRDELSYMPPYEVHLPPSEYVNGTCRTSF